MAAPTILFIGPTISAGYSPGSKQGVVVQPSDASGDIGLSVESILTAMPKKQKNVYVLTTEIWSQEVSVESRALRRIEKKQIPQVMAFEAESLSGIQASMSRTALRELRTQTIETNFWVSQIDSVRFAQTADAVAFSGCRLMGVLHPAGLPAAINKHKTNWSRLEQWGDSTLAVWRTGHGPVEYRFLEEPGTQVTSSAAARKFLSSVQVEPNAYVEVLQEASLATPLLPAETEPEAELLQAEVVDDAVVDFTKEADVERFLSAWATAFRRPPDVPVIRPVRAQASTQTKRTLALSLAAVSILLVTAHYHLSGMLNKQKVARLEQEITDLQQPIDSFKKSRTRLTEVKSQVAAVNASTRSLGNRLEAYDKRLEVHRARIASLLEFLATNHPRQLSINSITRDRNLIRITGRSIDTQSIEVMAEALAKHLETINFSLEVPRREALLLRADGAPYEFEFLIRDTESR